MWIDVCGKQELAEPDGCSYRNDEEVFMVMETVAQILEETDVQPTEIGIIAPYKLQV